MTFKRGGWLFGRDGTEPGWWGSWQNLVEGPDGEPAGPPWHGRAVVHPSGSDGSSAASVEWRLGSTAVRLCCDVDSTEGEIAFSVALPPVSIHLGVKARELAHLLRDRLGISELSTNGRVVLGVERETSLRVFDGSVWWRVWSDPNDWSSKTPRWQEGNVNVLRLLRGAETVTRRAIDRSEVFVPMPEGSYAATAKLEEVRVSRPRWPTEVFYTVTLTMAAVAGIPIPGNGESGYDLDEDAIFGSTMITQGIAAAIGELVGSVLERRQRHGGKNWQPAAKPVAVAA